MSFSNLRFDFLLENSLSKGFTLYLMQDIFWYLVKYVICLMLFYKGFYYPASIYLLNDNNRNTRVSSETCTKLTIKRRSGVFVDNFVHISHIVLVFLLLTLSRQIEAGSYVTFIQMSISQGTTLSLERNKCPQFCTFIRSLSSPLKA